MASFKKRSSTTTDGTHDKFISVDNNRKRTKVQEKKEKAAIKRIQKLDETIKKKDLIALKRREKWLRKPKKSPQYLN